MKKLFLAVALAICLAATPAIADEEFENKWSNLDKALFATYTVFNVVDILQTRYIMNDDNYYYEVNPVLKSAGRNGATALMVAANIIIYLGADYIGPKYRPWILTAASTLQIGISAHNYSIGVKFDF
jgi:Mg2+/citrate symporter